MSKRRPRRAAARAGIGDAAEDYLREIYKLQEETVRVTTSALARSMNVSAPSATAMVKKLAAVDLVEHAPYRGVRLTSAGERIALEVIRHHRLIELYLATKLEVGIDAVHDEADRLEHVLSEALELRIDELLGSPTHDPHGDPIPDARLKIEDSNTTPLTALEAGDVATVRKIPDGDAELLRYLAGLALVPGRRVQLMHAAPFKGPLTLRVNRRKAAISFELAEKIRVAATRSGPGRRCVSWGSGPERSDLLHSRES